MILIHLVWPFQGERIESQIQLFILEEWLYILANKSLDHMLAHSQLAIGRDTPGTAGGPGGHDRTLAVKSKKIARKSWHGARKPPGPKERKKDTPGTAGGPGGCDRTLALKSKKKCSKIIFFP